MIAEGFLDRWGVFKSACELHLFLMMPNFSRRRFVSLFRISSVAFFIFGAVFLQACGNSSEDSVGSANTYQPSTSSSGFVFSALSPLFLGFVRSCPDNPDPSTCNTIVSSAPLFNMSTLHAYDAVIEPDLSVDRSTVNSLITGMGIEVTDRTTGGALSVSLGVVARQYDYSSGKFLNSYRIFSAPGAAFDGAQDFSIRNAISDNIFLTGLGLSLRGATVTKLELQRKTLSKLGSRGQSLSAANQVILDNGWAAVGFLLRVSPRSGSMSVPFLQEVVMFTAQLNDQ